MNLASMLQKGKDEREMRASIADEIAAALAGIQRSRAERLHDRDLAWLALVPVWTIPLADEADFKGGGKSLEEFLEHAEALGFVVRQRAEETRSRRVAEVLHRNLDPQFWMPESERPRVIADLRDRLGPSALLAEISMILQRIPSDGGIPSLEQWLELARTAVVSGVGAAAELLRDRVRQLLEGGETGAALGWLRTGALLAQAMGGQLESAVMRGRREVEVAYRRAHDARALVGFLPRDEQIRDFATLVDGPDERWAIHFLGLGGAGKTMFIRHVNAELAAKHNCITARVDFDYISPNFPRLRPELLLVELADELRAHSAPEDFARFEDSVRSLQEAMTERAADGTPGDPLDTREFHAVQRAFANWLGRLPRRVVLILDTCEELAKFQPGGEMAPSIRATYRILEELHGAVPALRVIFAGRRQLALAGAGWKLRSDVLPEGRRHLPAEKDYLRLHLLRGFTEREAGQYFVLQKVAPADRLRGVILEKSRESEALIEHLDECALRSELLEGEPVPRPRSNPFDLSLYVQWLRETPGLTDEFIRQGGTDPYIDLRIVRRLTDGVRDLLPAVVFLRRFDEEMLRLAAPAREAGFAGDFRELAEQEWIDYQQDEAGVYLEVDRNLHPRLVRYFDNQLDRRRRWEDACRELGPGLARLVRGRIETIEPNSGTSTATALELGFDLVYAALRALEVEPAAELWEEIEARVIATGRWDWARTITARLLGEEEEGCVADALRPSLLATQASVMLHADLPTVVVSAWENVLAVAPKARPAARAGAVEERAWLGKIASSRPEAITPADVARLTGLWARLDDARGTGAYSFEQWAASLFAATETVVDGIEAGGKYGLLSVRDPASLPADALSPELRAFGFTLCGRLHRDKNRRVEADEAGRAGLDSARTETGQPAQRWAGWLAPDSIENFVALEWLLNLRWFDEAEGAKEAARQWKLLPGLPMPANGEDLPPALQLLDSERRVSLQLELLLGENLSGLEVWLLQWVESWDRYSGPQLSERAAHRAVVPLVVNLALAWLARGEAERAITLLDARLQSAKAGGQDSRMIAHCEQAKLRVFTRMRWRRRGEAMMARSLEAPELAPLGWPARALNGLPPAELPPGEERLPRELIHAWWRSRTGDDGASRIALGKSARAVFLRGFEDDRFPQAVMFADYAERDWYEAGGTPARWEGDLPRMLEEAIDEFRTARRLPIRELVRLNLRVAALRRDRSLPEGKLVGRRRLAELALEEGELLGLRLPELAMHLCDIAHENFMAAEDWSGALIAAICGASAAQRSNLGNNLAFHLRTMVQPAYERVVAGGARDFPTWQELEALAGVPPSDLRRLDHPVWAGWLHRLFRCQLAQTAGNPGAQLTWLARHYDGQFPHELGFSAETKKQALKNRQRSLLGEERLIQFGIWSTVVCLIVATGSFKLGFNKSMVFYATGFSYGLLFWTSLLGAAIKALAAWRFARGSVVMRIEPDGVFASADVAAYLRCHLRVETMGLNPNRVLTLAMSTPGLQRYREAAGEFPFEAGDFLANARRRLLGNAWWNRLAVPVVTPPSLGSPAWEALPALALPAQPRRFSHFVALGGRAIFALVGMGFLLGGILGLVGFGDLGAMAVGAGIMVLLPLFASWRMPGKELHFYRGGVRMVSDPKRAASWKDRRVEVNCSRQWQLLVEQGLVPFRKKKFWVSELHRSTPSGARSVLYAVGRAVVSTVGYQLEITNDETMVEQSAVKAATGRMVLGAEDLRRREAFLTIIQGEPLTESNARSESDRESAALLRAVGAGLFAAGAENVLVLPSLPAPAAEAVLRVIAKALAGSRMPSLHRLLDAVALARKTIRDWPPPSALAAKGPLLDSYRSDQTEASLDPCLFARSDLPSPPTSTGRRA